MERCRTTVLLLETSIFKLDKTGQNQVIQSDQ